MVNKLFLALIFFMMGRIITAQDTLWMRNGDFISCDLLEVNINEIVFVPAGKKMPKVLIRKIELEKVKLADGQEIRLQMSLLDEGLYNDDQKAVLKMDFFSPFLGYTELFYEKSLSANRSLEAGVGFLGLGSQKFNRRKNVVGLSAKIGYKYFLVPLFMFDSFVDRHVLGGPYIKPEVACSIFAYTPLYGGNPQRSILAMSGALLMTAGYQLVLSEAIVFDCYFSLGYGLSNEKYTGTEYTYNIWSADSPLTFMGGIKIGKLLKQKN